MEDLTFRVVDLELLDRTAAEWIARWQTREDSPPVYMEPLDSCRRALSGELVTSSNNRAIWYAVVSQDGNEALALADMIHTHNGGQLRLHRIIVAPDLEMSSGDDPDRRDFTASVAAHALIGALELTLSAHPSTSLKVWVSFPLTKYFLNTALAGFRNRLDVQVAGNWLTINFKK